MTRSITCRLCGKNEKPARAHIIPRAFYEQIRDAKGDPLEAHEPQGRMWRSWIGEWDDSILCVNCEAEFQYLDNYAIELLLNRRPQPSIYKDALVWPTIDYERLKLFFLFLLWRASVSKRKFFAQLSLGLAENVLQEYFVRRTPKAPDHFPAMVMIYEHELAKFVMAPRRQRLGSAEVVVFMMGQYKAVVGLGGVIPAPFGDFFVSDRLVVPRWRWEESFENRFMSQEVNWSKGAWDEFRNA